MPREDLLQLQLRAVDARRIADRAEHLSSDLRQAGVERHRAVLDIARGDLAQARPAIA
jgi:hypothetical protein